MHRQPGCAAKRKMFPWIDSSEEEEIGTSSGDELEGLNGSEAVEELGKEEANAAESGGEPRLKRRRRGKQQGRPGSGNHQLGDAGWEAMRAGLAHFEAEHGHCRVPQKHPADPTLGRWVSSQRVAKKKMDGGNPSPGITAERVAKLEAIGFEWSLRAGEKRAGGGHEAGWEAMRARLLALKAEHGHCRVPSKWTANPKLGRWVANQRAAKKRLDHGHPSPGITSERVAKLEAIGFD